MGPWSIVAIIAVAAFSTESGRAYAKKLFKSGVKAGIHARESAAELAEKAKDYKNELVAEIEAEAEEVQSANGSKKKTKTAAH